MEVSKIDILFVVVRGAIDIQSAREIAESNGLELACIILNGIKNANGKDIPSVLDIRAFFKRESIPYENSMIFVGPTDINKALEVMCSLCQEVSYMQLFQSDIKVLYIT